MANTVYNSTDIETTITNAGTISSNITSLTESVSTEISAIDLRVFNYFDCFTDAKNSNGYLGDEVATVDSFKDWMTETYADFSKTKATVEGMSGTGTTDLTLTEAAKEYPTINVDPSKISPYDLTSAAWNKLSTEEKKAIEAKLKELGFTDKEIQGIKDGNASVSKVTHEKLSSALAKLNQGGSDVRQVILEKYGFDVFNEDGTVNPDKLALAMLIDNKNPNDDYDLVNLLKTKYGIDLFPPEAGVPTTPGGPVTPTTPTVPNDDTTTTTPIDTTTPTTVHTGLSYGGDGIGNGTGSGVSSIDTSEIQNMLDGTEDDSLLDGIGSLTGSVLGGKDGFDIGFNDKDAKGSGVGLATGAGLAGLGMAATVGLLAKKKREQELVDGEDDDDDFDDDYDEDDLDSDNLLGSAVNGKNSYDEDDDDDDQDKFSVTRKKKDWLYGLGIGLAGAGLAAGLLAKDDDDEDEDEEDDD